MAWLYDEVNDVFVDDADGEVVDADGNYVGEYEDFYEDAGDDDSEYADDDSEVYEALLAAAHEEARADISDIREADAEARGYELARYQDELAEREDQQDEADFDESMTNLASRLQRPISNADAARILERLPEGDYSDDDVSQAAEQLNIRSFHDRAAPHGGGRAQRVAYMNQRANEIEHEDAHEREYEEAAGRETNSTPAYADLFERNQSDAAVGNDPAAERLAQAMRLD